ncbi:MAG: NADH:flavin oxidoreductase/NADH oxidase [Parachlamydia sp.]|jgi:2,4-dienoyl-CoA reductase (NADPH2)|nr:NADH:flavin oxidoreductase/NADH oxidase [Parachlamydia sp.]
MTSDNIKPHCAGCLSEVDHDRNFPDFDLFSPLKLRSVSLKNRIVLSPMCQYFSEEGFANDWHLVHLGSRAAGGASLIFTEACAVTAEGRISPADLGIWMDEHIEPLARITKFIGEMGAVPAIQLAHAGRKASCEVPWEGGLGLDAAQGGWEVVGPSPLPFSDRNPVPIQLSLKDIGVIIEAFKRAAERAIEAGFKVIEVHSAHGYLLHEFLSPLSNQRGDQYGGTFENRIRLLIEVVQSVRQVIPEATPLFVRISATDWMDNGWDLNQSVALAKVLCGQGVDLIDVSTGGLVPHAIIPVGPNYQVPFAREIRKEAGMRTGAVGLIKEPSQANEIITSGAADLVFIAREFLKEPYWALKAGQAMNAEVEWPTPYGYAIKRRK